MFVESYVVLFRVMCIVRFLLQLDFSLTFERNEIRRNIFSQKKISQTNFFELFYKMYFLFNVIRYDKKTLNLIEMIYKEQFTRVKNSKFDLFALVPA